MKDPGNKELLMARIFSSLYENAVKVKCKHAGNVGDTYGQPRMEIC
jgi:hypothetical protein